ncbi:AraC family transcriptional regulator [Rathayibacter sp. SD072]|uniref:AraC family transcriptional regulator n=1 Tax=Rathayibacter sp. SD072 TaxID=2781731 RepID=UPI001A96F8E8|nr:AraC family transcriptional regulator [Rathayibacter sp. SD072]MBO0985529.1 AraC family transcriptional regulator [Rathayibacter sp. SD072]
MDPLDHFLAGPRASRAFALLMRMGAPWGVAVRDGAALTLVAVTEGSARIDGRLLRAGDVALVTGADPYIVTDAAGSEASVVIEPGQVCRSLDGRDLTDELRHGVRRWGNAVDGETTLLVGAYDRADDVGGLVLRVLPRLAVVPSGDEGVVPLLVRELDRSGAAGQIVVDRLLDVLLVATIRRWAAESDADAWLACSDPVVVAALELLHAEPAAPWTVADLARRVCVSRASLAARFREGTGAPPMTYLTRWRLTLAGDLLLDPGVTIAAVARSVGYEDPFAFSSAFKRHVGATPTEFRRRPRSG